MLLHHAATFMQILKTFFMRINHIFLLVSAANIRYNTNKKVMTLLEIKQTFKDSVLIYLFSESKYTHESS